MHNSHSAYCSILHDAKGNQAVAELQATLAQSREMEQQPTFLAAEAGKEVLFRRNALANWETLSADFAT